MSDWSPQFKGLLNTPIGKELLRTLREDLHDNLVREAEQSKTQETAFGLLKEASGVIKTIEHLQMLAVVPSDGENRDKN